MLRLYDLDRQSILEDESKRIREITKNITNFFNEYNVVDTDIRFRFLNYKVKLPYERLKSTLDNEEDYDKILLFLSINHPDRFPDNISPEEFSKQFDINLIKLKFVILRIVEENIFPLKFFKLEMVNGKIFYFQANQKLEHMLSAIVDDRITKFTYLINLSEGTSEVFPSLTMESTVDVIISEITENLFNPSLKSALRRFLPDYINFMAYKIEKERKLIDTFDKLEGLIWKEVQYFDFSETKEESEKRLKLSFYLDPAKGVESALRKIDKAIEQSPKELNFFHIKTKILIYFDRYNEALILLDRIITDFPENEKDLQMKKASIYKRMRNLEGGLEIIEELIRKYPDDNDLLNFKAIWYQYLNNREEALGIMKSLIEREPDNGIFHDSYGEILMAFQEYKLAVDKFQTAIDLNPESWYIYQTYIKVGICYRELEKYELALDFLKKGKDLIDRSTSDEETKQMWHYYANPFIEEILALNEDF
jgi:tetratricopeptide (TPR) repeat protein